MPDIHSNIHFLPMLDQHTERRDAAENRKKLIAAAEEIFRCEGAENATLDSIAAKAGVGKGTLYRRFGGIHDLALAVLDGKERNIQDAIINGPPPLGPGPPPADRLVAFGHSMTDLIEEQGEILLLTERSPLTTRLRSSVYNSWHLHVTHLLETANPACDAKLLAHHLLAMLSAELTLFLRNEEEMSSDRLKKNFEYLVHRFTQ